MKCPLRIIAIPSSEARGFKDVYDCLKEECAWWDSENECCSICHITSIAIVLKYLLRDKGIIQ